MVMSWPPALHTRFEREAVQITMSKVSGSKENHSPGFGCSIIFPLFKEEYTNKNGSHDMNVLAVSSQA